MDFLTTEVTKYNRLFGHRLSPQWEFRLSQLEILILLGQHFDIDQAPGMTSMKTKKKKNNNDKNNFVPKAYDKSCF